MSVGKDDKRKASKAERIAERTMSSLRKRPNVVEALFISDIHWTEKPPVFRSMESNWIDKQEEYIQQLRKIHEGNSQAPIFMVGDLFTKWNSSPTIISKVISWLKGMPIYAIAGNHDTPYHNPNELHRSAYWTLVEAGVIKHMESGKELCIAGVVYHPFSFGFPVTPLRKSDGLCLSVALIHDYIWTKSTGFYGASEEKRYPSWKKKLNGYHLAVFGDNHKPFYLTPDDGCHILNCGTFMRCISDERSLKPSVSLLYTTGEVKRVYLDVAGDVLLEAKDEVTLLEKGLQIDLKEFADELNLMASKSYDFARAMMHWINDREDIADDVKAIIMRCVARGAKLHGYHERD